MGTALFLGDSTNPGQFILSSNPLPGVAVAVGDFNSDGIPDLIVSTDSPSSGTGMLGIALGDPKRPGQFQPVTEFASGGSANAAVGDFNGDGVLDLAMALGGSLNIFLGDPANPGQFLGRQPGTTSRSHPMMHLQQTWQSPILMAMVFQTSL